jgi:hypothetical protein
VSLNSQSVLLARWGCLLLHVPAVRLMTKASSCHACLECHRFYIADVPTSAPLRRCSQSIVVITQGTKLHEYVIMMI